MTKNQYLIKLLIEQSYLERNYEIAERNVFEQAEKIANLLNTNQFKIDWYEKMDLRTRNELVKSPLDVITFLNERNAKTKKYLKKKAKRQTGRIS